MINLSISVSYLSLYPIVLLNGKIISKTDEHSICSINSYCNEDWGEGKSYNLVSLESFPCTIELEYIDIVKQAFISVVIPFRDGLIDYIRNNYSHIIIGIVPSLYYAIWLSSSKKRVLYSCTLQKENNCSYIKHISICDALGFAQIDDYHVGIRSSNHSQGSQISDKMKQYVYKYIISHQESESDKRYNNAGDKFQVEFIEESLFDGTFDKLHDDGLLKYHKAGKPKKLAIKWYIKKSEYTAYFWFEDEKICTIFERFYGAHPDTKTDFIIRIDAEQKKYELALFRQGLKEPQIIPEDAYQLLVFKNKFEHYRSDNYNQERGAWIW